MLKQDDRKEVLPVPCGKCAACMNRKRNEWSFRLEVELKHCTSAYFVTLTYEDDKVPLNSLGLPSVYKRDCQLFLKRLRKMLQDCKIRYYMVSEYGSKTFRPHYHAIMYNLPADKKLAHDSILNSWSKGHVKVGSVTPQSIAYVTKYVITKEDLPDGLDPVFALMSRKPGLGYQYVDSHKDWHSTPSQERMYAVKSGGVKVSLPRYYRKKLFDEDYISRQTENYKQNAPAFDYDGYDEYKSKHPDCNIGEFVRYKRSQQQHYTKQLDKRIKKLDSI